LFLKLKTLSTLYGGRWTKVISLQGNSGGLSTETARVLQGNWPGNSKEVFACRQSVTWF